MAEEIKNVKYIVFNREEFNQWFTTLTELNIVPLSLDDAVVIRRKDVFAGPGLHAYAMAIQTALDLIDILGTVTQHEVEQLENLRDFFAHEAQLAVETPLKHLPD